MVFIHLKIGNKSFNKYDFCYTGGTKKNLLLTVKIQISEEVKSNDALQLLTLKQQPRNYC
jgi:hypothetical protein